MKNLIILIVLCICASCTNKSESFKLIPVKSGDKWGYIDNKGTLQINPQFEEANIFCDNVALVKNSDGKYGYIGEDGKYVINPTYKYATSFNDDSWACTVTENGKPQFIDKKGNVKLTVNNADYCGSFKDDLALIRTKDKYGYIDKTGNVKITPIYDRGEPFNDGLAAVVVKTKEGDYNWGYINKKGELTINYQFKRAGNFHEGLAVVYDGKKYGYIGKDGKYVINPQFDAAGEFENGYAIIYQGKDYGYIDKEGKIQINPQFSNASNFAENKLASVMNTDKHMGYIDNTGKYIINPQFDFATKFYGDIAFVESSGKFGIISKDGKFLVNPQFDAINISERNDWVNELIKSDYFDANALAGTILKDLANDNFMGLKSSSNLSQARKIFPQIKDDDISITTVAINNFTQPDQNVAIKSSLNFSGALYSTEPVYKNVQTYNYYYGGYYNQQQFDHYSKTFTNDAKLILASLVIDLQDKAIGKGKILGEALANEIKSKINGKMMKQDFNTDNGSAETDTKKNGGCGNYLIKSDKMDIYLDFNEQKENSVNIVFVFDTDRIKSFENQIGVNQSNSTNVTRELDNAKMKADSIVAAHKADSIRANHY